MSNIRPKISSAALALALLMPNIASAQPRHTAPQCAPATTVADEMIRMNSTIVWSGLDSDGDILFIAMVADGRWAMMYYTSKNGVDLYCLAGTGVNSKVRGLPPFYGTPL